MDSKDQDLIIEEEILDCEQAENSKQTESEAEKKYNELLDKYQRSLADFDNFRKRTVKEKSSMYNDGVNNTIEKLLPVLDNLERALASEQNKESSFYKGVEMIIRQFNKLLEDLGVSIIETKGCPFNHDVHFAVAHVKDENFEENMVVEEMQRGYKLKDKVIRPAMVKVAN